MKRVGMLAVCLVLCWGWAAGQGDIRIAGKVLGASGRHPVYVALWDSAAFLRRPVREIQLPAASEMAFSFEVAPGRWTLSAYEDRNGDGKLNIGLFGPKEPNGFVRRFTAWRKPRFGDVALLFTRDTANADIQLR